MFFGYWLNSLQKIEYFRKIILFLFFVNKNTYTNMLIKRILPILFLLLGVATVNAQSDTVTIHSQDIAAPYKVENVTIKDLNGVPTPIPQFGEKNLLIFYVDPDSYLRGGRNKRLSDELEENKRAEGPAIHAFGVMNFPDTGLPKKFLRSIIRKRIEKNGATILEDDQHLLRDGWKLGDCNNCFAYIVVSKEGELVYVAKENLDEAGLENFYNVIEKYRK